MSIDHPQASRRALVLGGGGVAGIAWHVGMLAEFLEQGIELGAADLVIGTSAGSVAASALRFDQIASAYEIQVSPEAPDLPASGASAPALDMTTFRERIAALLEGAEDAQDARARLGAAAVAAAGESGESGDSVLVPMIEAQFPAEAGWPAAPLGVTVVDAITGEFRVLDASSGVPLPRAVAASCSVPLVFPPVDIEGRPHIDGGMRSATNTDVTEGYDTVLVLACGPEDPASPLGPQLDEAVETLRANGSSVLVLTADADALEAFGTNSMAATSRIPSAHAGRRQAHEVAASVREFWG
ncbi:MAG: hypothetical protein JWP75_3400 [Frondihabitans sp.]|nr:hypothetical protein [Frondihabitans sp.]